MEIIEILKKFINNIPEISNRNCPDYDFVLEDDYEDEFNHFYSYNSIVSQMEQYSRVYSVLNYDDDYSFQIDPIPCIRITITSDLTGEILYEYKVIPPCTYKDTFKMWQLFSVNVLTDEETFVSEEYTIDEVVLKMLSHSGIYEQLEQIYGHQ